MMMFRYFVLTTSILLVALIDLTAQRTEPARAANTVQSLGELPVSFVPNRGQVADTRGERRPDVLYTASSQNTHVFVRANTISYVFHARTFPDAIDSDHRHHDDEESSIVDSYRMDIELVGARTNVDVVEENIGQGVRHYYLAQCPDGILNVPSFAQVTLKNVYAKVDMVLRGSERGMKCEFIVHPGGNPSDIVMRYVGASKVMLTDDGGVSAATPLGDLYESAPVSFQDVRGAHRDVASAFHLVGDQLSFDIGPYDHSHVLVIDPVRRWSTYYGGPSNELLNGGDPTEVDREGNAIVTGYVNANNFPVTTGAHQTTNGGGDDAFVVKLNGNGALQWATYYGGTSGEISHGVVCDTSRNVFIAGHTNSSNFPTQNAAQSVYGGSRDAFVVKFSKLGVRQWATFYGGNQFDDGYGFASDSAGNVALLVTAVSSGLQTTGMVPIATHPVDANGNQDILIAKFSPSGTLLWATYFGGNDIDYGYAAGTDTSEAIIVTGWTYSTNLPLTSATQSTYGGNGDVVVARFSKDGARIWSTYYGG
ncbi:MAG: SBBP repeat-containing protein, partial [bacterium]|nr:SBBP repeat-containing protein [Candidatus Kapabacteria bacterium]